MQFGFAALFWVPLCGNGMPLCVCMCVSCVQSVVTKIRSLCVCLLIPDIFQYVDKIGVCVF